MAAVCGGRGPGAGIVWGRDTVIIDLDRFIADESPYWDELESLLERLHSRTGEVLEMAEAKRLYYLYRRTASGLARLQTFAVSPPVTEYLEGLVSRAYGEVHEVRRGKGRFRPFHWFLRGFPQTVRRRWRALSVSVVVTLVGALFGVVALTIDDAAKGVIIPFSHLGGSPSDRVAYEEEEAGDTDPMEGRKAAFASQLMTHNTKVSIFALALGITWGAGTLLILFSNGVMLGAVCLDYVRDGQTEFLAGWLLPHGSIEIPAILLAGQAGLILGGALIGYGDAQTMRGRLRASAPDICTLIFGVAVMLIWAGIIESFFSQYHAPILPYWFKISFGVLELAVLCAFLGFAGRRAGKMEALNDAR